MSWKLTALRQQIFAGIVNSPFSDKVRKKDLKESFFSEKPVFLMFPDIELNIPACYQMSFGKVVKTAFYVSIAAFSAKTFIW